MRYSKPHLAFSSQIQLLHQRGLEIADPLGAEAFLEGNNYYRLSAYFRPFYECDNRFLPGTSFEDIVALYRADSFLRHWLSRHLETWEIRFRTQAAYWHSHRHGAEGYADPANFHRSFGGTHASWLERNLTEFAKSKEVFAAHFAGKYGSSPCPPVWMFCETLTFGSTSRFLQGMEPDLQDRLAGPLGISKEVLVSWAHAMVYVRNLCAHHGRLWNRNLAVKAMVPRKWGVAEFGTDRVFRIITVLEYLERILTGDSLATSWSEALERFPQRLWAGMGVPKDWDALWNQAWPLAGRGVG